MVIRIATSISCFRGPIAVTNSKPWPENSAYPCGGRIRVFRGSQKLSARDSSAALVRLRHFGAPLIK